MNWTQYTPQTLINRLRPLFDQVVEHYETDLDHDVAFVKRIEGKEWLRGLCHGMDVIYYSVGDHGSHIGIVPGWKDPIWYDRSFEGSYRNYVHYRIMFRRSPLGTPQFKVLPWAEELTSDKYLSAKAV